MGRPDPAAGPYTFVAANALVLKAHEGGPAEPGDVAAAARPARPGPALPALHELGGLQ